MTKVAGRQPGTLADLVGATTVTVETHGQEEHLIGTGLWDEQSVLFYEKETGSARESDLVWTFTDQGSGGIAAEPPAPDGVVTDRNVDGIEP